MKKNRGSPGSFHWVLRSYSQRTVVVSGELHILTQIRLLCDPSQIVDGHLTPCAASVFAWSYDGKWVMTV
jgi:hypothetical protein